MLFSMSSPAYATEFAQREPTLLEVYTIDSGVYYRYSLNHSGGEWIAIVFVPNDGRDVSFSAVQINTFKLEQQTTANDDIYTLTIEPESRKAAVDYLRDGFSSLQRASIISTSTNKIYRHCGLNERNNETRAYLQDGDPEPDYYPSSSYYSDYLAQVSDAYDLYLSMNS